MEEKQLDLQASNLGKLDHIHTMHTNTHTHTLHCYIHSVGP